MSWEQLMVHQSPHLPNVASPPSIYPAPIRAPLRLRPHSRRTTHIRRLLAPRHRRCLSHRLHTYLLALGRPCRPQRRTLPHHPSARTTRTNTIPRNDFHPRHHILPAESQSPNLNSKNPRAREKSSMSTWKHQSPHDTRSRSLNYPPQWTRHRHRALMSSPVVHLDRPCPITRPVELLHLRADARSHSKFSTWIGRTQRIPSPYRTLLHCRIVSVALHVHLLQRLRNCQSRNPGQKRLDHPLKSAEIQVYLHHVAARKHKHSKQYRVRHADVGR